MTRENVGVQSVLDRGATLGGTLRSVNNCAAPDLFLVRRGVRFLKRD